jgi:hypothetical protein
MTQHLLIIGAQRSGTTYLYRILDEHPQVAMARPARPEPKFFLDPQQWQRGIDWYRQTYFSGRTAAVLGEKSTSYMESPDAAARAGQMLGSAQIIAVLRDPVARAVSNWRFSSASGLETRPLDVALAENLRAPQPWDPTKTSVSPFAYLERGRYVDHLAAWAEHFGQQLHVLFTDEVTDPAGPATVYRLLGVDAGYRPAVAGTTVNAAEHPAQELDPALAEQVRDFFSDSDRRLVQLLGRDVPWRSTSSVAGG